jgi:hypothetical protein
MNQLSQDLAVQALSASGFLVRVLLLFSGIVFPIASQKEKRYSGENINACSAV